MAEGGRPGRRGRDDQRQGRPKGGGFAVLANVYLHYVFDLWANRWRQREATGDMIIVRYADDSVPRTY